MSKLVITTEKASGTIRFSRGKTQMIEAFNSVIVDIIGNSKVSFSHKGPKVKFEEEFIDNISIDGTQLTTSNVIAESKKLFTLSSGGGGGGDINLVAGNVTKVVDSGDSKAIDVDYDYTLTENNGKLGVNEIPITKDDYEALAPSDREKQNYVVIN